MATLKAQIKIRRDLSINWNNINPVLADGEIGLELDTDKIKIGNNINAWNDLPYLTEGVLADIRRKTKDEWTVQNTILEPGELGFETDTHKVKIGDGTSTWNQLSYLIGETENKISLYDETETNGQFEEVMNARILVTRTDIGETGDPAPDWSNDKDIIYVIEEEDE